MKRRFTRRSAILGGFGAAITTRGFRRNVSAQGSTPEADYTPTIDPAQFSTTIDNPYFPLTPGTTLFYEGEADGAAQSEEFTVTFETREVMGVQCVVVHDIVSEEGEVVEDTLDWFAQDADGNVWYFGEESKDIEGGEVVSTEGSWEAGVDGALPGIVMPANPQVGDAYRQEYYAGEAEDMAEVIALDETVSVPNGEYSEVLVTEDRNPLEPEFVEHKYYAKGVGMVFEELVEGGEEFMELVRIEQEDEDASPEADDDDEPGDVDEQDEEGDEDDYDY
jgi:hypothetical protein